MTIPPLAYSIDVLALAGQAKSDAKLYAGPKDKPRRDIYKKDNPEIVKDITKKARIKVLKDEALENATVMSITIGIFGGIFSLGFIGGPLVGAPLLAVGIGSGIALGGVFIDWSVKKEINIEIKLSDHYAQWRSQAITENVYPIFKSFIDADKVFEDFLCPIEQDICSIPMLAPDGRTYNQDSIYKHIQSLGAGENDYIVSPIRGQNFRKVDLVIDSQYCKKLIAKAEQVYLDVIKYGKDNNIKHGISAVIKNKQDLMESIRLQMYFQLNMAYEDDLRKGILTPNEVYELVKKGTKQWDYRQPV